MSLANLLTTLWRTGRSHLVHRILALPLLEYGHPSLSCPDHAEDIYQTMWNIWNYSYSNLHATCKTWVCNTYKMYKYRKTWQAPIYQYRNNLNTTSTSRQLQRGTSHFLHPSPSPQRLEDSCSWANEIKCSSCSCSCRALIRVVLYRLWGFLCSQTLRRLMQNRGIGIGSSPIGNEGFSHPSARPRRSKIKLVLQYITKKNRLLDIKRPETWYGKNLQNYGLWGGEATWSNRFCHKHHWAPLKIKKVPKVWKTESMTVQVGQDSENWSCIWGSWVPGQESSRWEVSTSTRNEFTEMPTRTYTYAVCVCIYIYTYVYQFYYHYYYIYYCYY